MQETSTIPKNLLPASLMEKPKTLEEFQEFFFYWEPNLPFTEHSYAEGEDGEGYQYPKEDVKEFKLILWNARKIKKLTNSEIYRIYALYRGYNCFEVWSGQSKLHRMTAKEIKEEKSRGYDVDYIKYKGWKDSDNPKDPQID